MPTPQEKLRTELRAELKAYVDEQIKAHGLDRLADIEDRLAHIENELTVLPTIKTTVDEFTRATKAALDELLRRLPPVGHG